VARERTRPDVARRRAQWLKFRPRVDPSRLVFIDETWTKTNMAPLRGWAPRGARLPGAAPFGHWNTLTFLAALRQDRIEAPWLLDGPINGERFLIYVEKVLAPSLLKGDLVVMDNLGSHKAKAVRQAIRQTGARLLFLPKYSTRSSSSSASSSITCAEINHALATPSATPSPPHSTRSHHVNAQTTLLMPDTPNLISSRSSRHYSFRNIAEPRAP
jgi:putative transposase